MPYWSNKTQFLGYRIRMRVLLDASFRLLTSFDLLAKARIFPSEKTSKLEFRKHG